MSLALEFPVSEATAPIWPDALPGKANGEIVKTEPRTVTAPDTDAA